MIEQKFAQYLEKIGVPKNALVFQPSYQSVALGRRFRPDVAIVNPETRDPLAIIEVKGLVGFDVIAKTLEFVQRYASSFSAGAVRSYVAVPGHGEEFDIYTSDIDGKPKLVPAAILLNYENLVGAHASEKKEALEEEKKQTTDSFQKVCIGASAFATALAIADFVCARSGIELLTSNRMALIGIAIALAVIPYVQKIKALGVELDRGQR
jgi:hypothetical protein